MRASTDYANADKYADMAEAAATAAETARDNAKTAADAAYMAAMDAMDAMTSADAEAERAKAMARNRIATANHTGDDGAGPKYMAAKAAEVKSIGAAIATAATADDGAQIGGATAITAEWPVLDAGADTADDATDDEPGTLKITFTPEDGDPITSDMMGTDANKDGDTDDEGDTKPNAKKIAGIGAFMHGFDISSGGTCVLAFTDRKQATAAVDAASATYAVVTTDEIEKLGTKSGNMYTGVEFDHDGGTMAVPGVGIQRPFRVAERSVMPEMRRAKG